jgi:uncharacterized membrane protein
MAATAVASAATSGRVSVRPSPDRFDSIDLLRGVVMVLMALDHVRDYFTSARFDPTDLSQTTAGLFLTRWVTHFCAPVFIFLAGTGAFLRLARGRSRNEVARFLVTRGVVLVLLEFTVVRLAWTFDLEYASDLFFVQVIWVLGISMVVLAALVYLPLPLVGAVGMGMIAGHNLLDGLTAQEAGGWGPLWTLLHVQGPIALPGGRTLFVAYPLIPWIGVMATGYAFGRLLQRPAAERRRSVIMLGAALTVGFVFLRAVNLYGDPAPWSRQTSAGFTLLSFLNTTKYPASLLFLLMTLGPALLALAAFERATGVAARFFVLFGRVPLFYYILHLFVIHAAALALGTLAGFAPRQFMAVWVGLPDGWGYGLPVIYLVWAGVILALYPACRWFATVKSRRRDPWLSYL